MTQDGEERRADIARMQEGIKAWVQRVAGSGGRRLRDISPAALLSLLCASAFASVIAAGAGVTAATAEAGIGVLSSVGSGALADVITGVLRRWHRHGKRPESSSAEFEEDIARQLERALAAGDATAEAVRSEIAAVLAEIDAGGTMLRAAIDTQNSQLRSDMIAAIAKMYGQLADMEFLLTGVEQAAVEIQRGLDEQGASSREIIDQNNRQSIEIRLIREQLDRIEKHAAGHAATATGLTGPGRRQVSGCPYRGLATFTEADEAIFCGRDGLIADLAVRLAQHRTRGGLVVVTGASGAGKSSLLRAGLIPALARGVQVEGSQRWPRIVITPTSDPLTGLATHLAALGRSDPAAVRERLASQPDNAHMVVQQAVLADTIRSGGNKYAAPESRDVRLVLVVDQFEQIFTLNQRRDGEADRRAFVAALTAAATNAAAPGGHPPALVIVVVRGDFCDRCAGYSHLARALNEGTFVVGPMTEPELRLAITGPADAAGLRLDPNLTDTILADLRGVGGLGTVGVLPLLSQAMLLTWENREEDRLTSRGYARAGGVRFAVQACADAVYDSLSADQQDLARSVLRSMTVASGDGRLARRPATRADLYAEYPEAGRSSIDAVLEAFAARRLIILDNSTAQIAHDALLAVWPKLRGWLEEDQASWILYGQFAGDAAAWRDHGDDPSFLYRGTQLTTILQAVGQWSENPHRYPSLTSTERQFLDASSRADARRRRQRRVIGAALVVLLAASLAGAGLAAVAAKKADRQRALAVSNQLAVQSEQLDATNPVLAARLALAAWRIAPTGLARESLLQVVTQPERAVLASDIQMMGGPGEFAFSPDGKALVTTSVSGAQLWDVATRRQVGGPIRVSDAQVDAVAFSPDGKVLATISRDGAVRLWDVATHRQVGVPMAPANPAPMGDVVFSPDGKTLATTDANGFARLWDVTTHHQIGQPITGTLGVIGTVAFSPDGKTLVTAGIHGIQLWDVTTHLPKGAPLIGGYYPATAFSPNGKTLATAGGDGKVRFWDVATQLQISAPIITGGPISAVAFSPNRQFLATAGADGIAHVWDIATRRRIGATMDASTAGDMNAIAFSPDGKILASVSLDGATRLWNPFVFGQLGQRMVTGKPGDFGPAVAFSPSGKIVAATCSRGIQLWAVATHHRIGPPITTSPGADAVAFSPDGKILAFEDSHGIQLWAVATHHRIGRPIATGPGVDDIAFRPDGKTLATAGADGKAELWNISTHRQVASIKAASANYATESAAFDRDGKILVTGGDDGKARLWKVATWHQIGQSIAVSSTDIVEKVLFSRDGQILATGSNGSITLWSVATHRQIGAPTAFAGDLNTSWALSSNGKILATEDDIGTVRLWDVALPLTQDMPTAACSIAGRSLSPQEWRTYITPEPYQRVCP